MTTCGRCKREIESGPAERCWYCQARLCFACWDDVGHCGHPEAEAQNQTARATVQAEVAGRVLDQLNALLRPGESGTP